MPRAASCRQPAAGWRLGGLRAIIREHRLDPRGRTTHVNDADRLRTVILEATAEQGR